MNRDYVPQSHTRFSFFMRNLLTYVGQNIAAWTTIPQERLTELNNAFAEFTEASNAALETPTPANHNTRNEAQANTTRLLRAFVNQFLRFPPVTNSDRIEMGIPNHDTIRTDHKVVTELVDFVIHVNSQRELSIDFWQEGQPHKAKPHGYDGAVLVWDILDAPPENQDALNQHTMASRTPYTLIFDETERGKRVYVALRWQNERGITGAWSDIKDAIVP